MKSDIITIIPEISFDTDKQKIFGKRRFKEYTLPDYFKFGKVSIFSYKKLKEGKIRLPKYQSDQLQKLYDTIIDAAGNKLEDFAIVYEKNVDRKDLTIQSSDAEELLSYFAHRQNITHWVQLGSLKIECMHGAGRIIHINNLMEHFSPKYSYMLPIEQNHKTKIRYSASEKTLTKVLEHLSKRNPDEYARLLRAIRFYNSASSNEYRDRNTSIVLFSAALEALFDYSPPSNQKKFSYAAKVHLGFSEKVEIWAEEFYSLRSTIVHGSKVLVEDLLLSGLHKRGVGRSVKTRHQSHLEIAKDVFDECIFLQLENMGLVKVNKEYKEERIRSIIERIIPNIDKIDLLKNKQFNFENFKKRKKLYRQFLLRIESFTSTDYSGSRRIKEVIKVICQISKDWFEKDTFPWLEEAKKRPGRLGVDTLTSYGESLKKIYDYLPVLNAAKYGFELDDRISDMRELCRQCEPIWHAKDVFRFIITEFLDRSLRALFGTFQYDIGKGMPKGKIKRVRKVQRK